MLSTGAFHEFHMRISVRSTIPMGINVGDWLPLEENGPMLLESREREEMRGNEKKKKNLIPLPPPSFLKGHFR